MSIREFVIWALDQSAWWLALFGVGYIVGVVASLWWKAGAA